MKLQLCGPITAAVVLCLNVNLGGQDASTATGRSVMTSQPDTPPRIIVGCLVRGLPNTDGRAPTGTATTEDYFVRTPTVRVPPGTTVAVGTPGTTSTTTSTGTPAGDSYFRVVGLTADQLRPHLEQRVEIQGRLADNMPGTEKRRVTTTQDKDGRVKVTIENQIEVAGVLQATAIKMVSASCEK